MLNNKFIAMKKMIFLWVLLMAGFTTEAQIEQNSQQKQVNKPKIQVKVNKVYDENGNIIRYDSTYSWSYSSGNKKGQIDVDSLMQRFMPYFHEHFPDALSREFSNPFFQSNDSSMMLDFFNNDHFFKQWQNQLFDFQKQIREMDSVKREFFKHFMRRRFPKETNKPKAGIY